MQSNYRWLLIFPFIVHSVVALPLFSDDKVHCSPTTWQDIFVFFLANYVAHAAAVPSPPGSGWLGSFQWVFLCLLHPFAGLGRAAIVIWHHCAFGKDEIGKALSVSALAVVARTETWKPPTDSKCKEELLCSFWPNWLLKDEEPTRSVEVDDARSIAHLHEESLGEDEIPTATVIIGKTLTKPTKLESLLPNDYVNDNFDASEFLDVNSGYKIHGNHILPDGYHWVTPSPANTFDLVKGLKDRSGTQVAQSSSLFKMAISIGQLVLSCITLYRTRGKQLDTYGYAAFGLSAFPYAFMSLINLICIGCMGSYPYLFMLQTPTMQEAKGRPGAVIGGEVGILQTAHRTQNNRRQRSHASGLDEVEMELRPLVAGGSGKKSGSVTTRLWTDTSANLLWARLGNSQARKYRLVKPDQQPTFVFRVHPFHNWLHIYQSKLKLTDYQRSPHTKTTSRQCLWERLQPFTERTLKFWKLPIGLAVKTVIAITSPVLGLVFPYVVIYCLTGFQPRSSTLSERSAMTSWLISAQYVMLMEAFVTIRLSNFPLSFSSSSVLHFFGRKDLFWLLMLSLTTYSYIGAPIHGFLAVKGMLQEFGSCSLS